MGEDPKMFLKIVGSILTVCLGLGFLFGSISAHYQSQITGYSFAQCLWAGGDIHNIILKKIEPRGVKS